MKAYMKVTRLLVIRNKKPLGPESSLDLSEEERYFSVHNDTLESLEEISDSIDSSNKNNYFG